MPDPVFSVTFVNPQLQNVFVANSAIEDEPPGTFGPGDKATFSVSFDNALAPGALRAVDAWSPGAAAATR